MGKYFTGQQRKPDKFQGVRERERERVKEAIEFHNWMEENAKSASNLISVQRLRFVTIHGGGERMGEERSFTAQKNVSALLLRNFSFLISNFPFNYSRH